MHALYCHLWPARIYSIFALIVCFDFLYNFCLKYFSFLEEMSEMLSKMYITHVNYPLFLSDFNETSILSTDFRKNIQISAFIKIHLAGAELLHADRPTDGQIDMTKLIVAFRNFAKASEIVD